MRRHWFLLAVTLVLLAGAALALTRPWAARAERETAAQPRLAQARVGPPPEPGPGHTVNYPKPLEFPTTFPPWHFVDPPAEVELPEPNPPATADDLTRALAEGRTRCREGVRTRLYLLDHDRLALDLSAEEALALRGSVRFEAGRFKGRQGLPLSALLRGRADVRTVEAWPCAGDPLRLSMEELTAAPARYVLILSTRRGFKLVALDGERAGTLIRNLAAIRLVR